MTRVPGALELSFMTRNLLAALTASLLMACPSVEQRSPAARDDGVQLTGELRGARIHVSDGEPEVLYGDCDPGDGEDVDLCMVASMIDGGRIGFVIENPEVLVEGGTLTPRAACPPQPVSASPPRGCDGTVIVEIRYDTERLRPLGGMLTVSEAGPRYAARFTLRFAGGILSGAFDVRPPATP